ncbi:MAG: hypothetical protein A2657_01470 [Candidatus Yanofskybacteria bacterium RIFCSPHIGHO2_01_FULL_44_110b]|nr:MAG: hypothetical protein A2657_01470 [Candidatus Yanofskybacteria bacterium RIFCSPHIGHO2_01_FULL_44_110b]
MRGVFGAGVATVFEKNNLYPKINAVYGASAGAMTGAYFLARQRELGPSIYYENLDGKFISRKDFLIGVWQRFQNRFIKTVPNDKLRDALDIEYLMNVVKNKKPLDYQKIISQDIPLNVKLFNLDTHEIEYIDARRSDIFEILKAGVNVFPYVHEVSVIDGKKYIDAAIMDIVGFDFLRKKHPNEKIIIVMNGQIDRKFRYRAKNILEGKFMQWMFNDSGLYHLYATAEDKLAKDIEKIKADANSLLIAQDRDVSVRSRTTDAKLLLEMYNLGIEVGNRALQSLL